VEVRVQGKELLLVDDFGWVATGKDMNQVVGTLEACAVERIEWASRRDLQFDTTQAMAVLFTSRPGHKTHLRPKLKAKIEGANSFVRFNKEATRWLGVSMDAHLMFKEYHNRCLKQARAGEAQLCSLKRMDGTVPERVRAVQKACVQPVPLYGSELWWYPDRSADERIFNSCASGKLD